MKDGEYMSIGSRIKELREQKNISRNDFATIIGVTVGAISNYENDVSSPKEPILFKIIEALDCDANYLFQDVVKLKAQQNDVTLAEYEMIKKYRFISTHSPEGKEVLDCVIENEYARAQSAFNIEDQQTIFDFFNPEDLEELTRVTQLPDTNFSDELKEMLKDSPFQSSWCKDYVSSDDFYNLPNAAHVRTDIEIPSDTDTTDNDIMNSKDF